MSSLAYADIITFKRESGRFGQREGGGCTYTTTTNSSWSATFQILEFWMLLTNLVSSRLGRIYSSIWNQNFRKMVTYYNFWLPLYASTFCRKHCLILCECPYQISVNGSNSLHFLFITWSRLHLLLLTNIIVFVLINRLIFTDLTNRRIAVVTE